MDALYGELREALEGMVADVQGSVGGPHYSQPPSILHLFEYSELEDADHISLQQISRGWGGHGRI